MRTAGLLWNKRKENSFITFIIMNTETFVARDYGAYRFEIEDPCDIKKPMRIIGERLAFQSKDMPITLQYKIHHRIDDDRFERSLMTNMVHKQFLEIVNKTPQLVKQDQITTLLNKSSTTLLNKAGRNLKILPLKSARDHVLTETQQYHLLSIALNATNETIENTVANLWMKKNGKGLTTEQELNEYQTWRTSLDLDGVATENGNKAH